LRWCVRNVLPSALETASAPGDWLSRLNGAGLCPPLPTLRRRPRGRQRTARGQWRSVGDDRGADRASNDADVSSIPPIIPYGGFSPVRLEGWPFRRGLPNTSANLSLLPACAGRCLVCVHPSCASSPQQWHRSESGLWARLRTAIRWSLHHPRGPRSGPGYSVPVRHHLIGPIRPTRGHIAISPHGGLYAMPSLCGSAGATRERFRAFAAHSLLACRPLRPRGVRSSTVPEQRCRHGLRRE
jgi:hypothetical protein